MTPARHGLDVGPGTALGQGLAQRFGVIGRVGEQDVAGAKRAQHVAGGATVIRDQGWKYATCAPMKSPATLSGSGASLGRKRPRRANSLCTERARLT